jgi:hypothetical protein
VSYQDAASQSSDKAIYKALLDGYNAMKTASADYAKALGANADSISTRTDSINFAIGKDATETQANVTKALADIGDSMANSLVPNLQKFALEGETAGNTLARLATSFTTVNPLLTALGQHIFDIGAQGADAAYKLAQAFGGLDQMKAAASSYYSNIYSDSEKLAYDTQQLDAAFKGLGVAVPASKEDFKKLVEGLDLTSDANKTLFAGLLNLSGAFASVQDRLDAAGQSAAQLADQQQAALQASVTTARNDLTTAYNAESSALQGTIDKFTQFSASLKQFRDGLLTGNLSILSPEQKYAAAQAGFDKTYSLAKSGDPTAMGNLQSAAQALLDASKAYNASGQGYVDDFNKVQSSLTYAATAADQQVSLAQNQLAALNQSVAGILDVNKSVMSVHDALTAYFNAKNGVGSAGSGAGGGGTANAEPAGFANVRAYEKQYGGDAYDFVNKEDGTFTADAGAQHYAQLQDNVAQYLAIAKNPAMYADQSKFAGGSSVTADQAWLLETGHTQAYWQAVTTAFDAGQHPTASTTFAGVDNTQYSSTVNADGSLKFAPVNGSHANGLDYVPFDGYRAELHKGEMVVTAAKAQSLRGGESQESVAELKEQTKQLRALVALQSAANQALLGKLAESNATLSDIQRKAKLEAAR